MLSVLSVLARRSYAAFLKNGLDKVEDVAFSLHFEGKQTQQEKKRGYLLFRSASTMRTKEDNDDGEDTEKSASPSSNDTEASNDDNGFYVEIRNAMPEQLVIEFLKL